MKVTHREIREISDYVTLEEHGLHAVVGIYPDGELRSRFYVAQPPTYDIGPAQLREIAAMLNHAADVHEAIDAHGAPAIAALSIPTVSR